MKVLHNKNREKIRQRIKEMPDEFHMIEVYKDMDITQSSATRHIKCLVKAGELNMEWDRNTIKLKKRLSDSK